MPNKQKLFYSIPLVDRLGHLSTELFYLRNIYPIESFDYHIFIPPLKNHPKTNLFMLRKVTEGMTLVETEDQKLLMAGHTSGPEVTVEERDGDLYILMDGGQMYHNFVAKFQNKQPHFHYSLNQDEVSAGYELRRQFSIPQDAPVVTLHVRDRGFLPHLNYHSYRDANIENYIPAVEYLLGLGVYVVRIGDPSMKQLHGLPPNYIDATFHPAYNNFVEPYFIASSIFHLGMISGPQSVATAFNKPMLYTNTLLSVSDWPGSSDLVVPRKFYSHKLNRFLTYEEILFSPMISYWETKLYVDAGIQLVENSPQELLLATQEMLAHLTGVNDMREERARLNIRAKSICKRLHDYRVATQAEPPFYPSQFTPAEISYSFLQMNPWFLGHDFGA